MLGACRSIRANERGDGGSRREEVVLEADAQQPAAKPRPPIALRSSRGVAKIRVQPPALPFERHARRDRLAAGDPERQVAEDADDRRQHAPEGGDQRASDAAPVGRVPALGPDKEERTESIYGGHESEQLAADAVADTQQRQPRVAPAEPIHEALHVLLGPFGQRRR